MKPSSIQNPLQGHTHTAEPRAYNVVGITNYYVSFCLQGGVTALTTPGYIIYKHADVDY